MRTLYISGGAASLDLAVKAVYIFALHIPLFLFGCVAVAAWLRALAACIA